MTCEKEEMWTQNIISIETQFECIVKMLFSVLGNTFKVQIGYFDFEKCFKFQNKNLLLFLNKYKILF